MRLNMKMHLGRSFWVGPIRFDLKKYCFEELSSSSNFILNFELILSKANVNAETQKI